MKEEVVEKSVYFEKNYCLDIAFRKKGKNLGKSFHTVEILVLKNACLLDQSISS